jgi:hypothetical protein
MVRPATGEPTSQANSCRAWRARREAARRADQNSARRARDRDCETPVVRASCPWSGWPRLSQPGRPTRAEPGGPCVRQPGGPTSTQPGGPEIRDCETRVITASCPWSGWPRASQPGRPTRAEPGGPGVRQPGGPTSTQPGGPEICDCETSAKHTWQTRSSPLSCRTLIGVRVSSSSSARHIVWRQPDWTIRGVTHYPVAPLSSQTGHSLHALAGCHSHLAAPVATGNRRWLPLRAGG